MSKYYGERDSLKDDINLKCERYQKRTSRGSWYEDHYQNGKNHIKCLATFMCDIDYIGSQHCYKKELTLTDWLIILKYSFEKFMIVYVCLEENATSEVEWGKVKIFPCLFKSILTFVWSTKAFE